MHVFHLLHYPKAFSVSEFQSSVLESENPLLVFLSLVQTDFRDYPPLLRQAVSVARKIQDPLVEFAQVCSSDEDILCLKLHPLQVLCILLSSRKFFSPHRLLYNGLMFPCCICYKLIISNATLYYYYYYYWVPALVCHRLLSCVKMIMLDVSYPAYENSNLIQCQISVRVNHSRSSPQTQSCITQSKKILCITALSV